MRLHTVLLMSAILVPISSFFGVQAWENDGDFTWIWEISAVANVMFTVGTIAAAYGAYRVARRIGMATHPSAGVALAIVLGMAFHWVVYWLSWTMVVSVDSDPISGAGDAPLFVIIHGWAGLLVAALYGAGLTLVDLIGQTSKARRGAYVNA